MKFWLSNDDQTKRAGAALAEDLLPLAEGGPVVVFVRGNLGAGKSTFVRGFLTHAGITGVMPSPTYSLVEPYQTDKLKVFHMDAYRIADGAELDYLGLDDADQPGSVLLVEWPDHVKDDLPAPTATVNLKMSRGPNAPDLAVDRHKTPAVDRHKTSGGGALDRHASGKTLVEAGATRALDRHTSGKALVEAEAVDSHGAGGLDRHTSTVDREYKAESPKAPFMGREIELVPGTAPYQPISVLGHAEQWCSLCRVVT